MTTSEAGSRLDCREKVETWSQWGESCGVTGLGLPKILRGFRIEDCAQNGLFAVNISED